MVFDRINSFIPMQDILPHFVLVNALLSSDPLWTNLTACITLVINTQYSGVQTAIFL